MRSVKRAYVGLAIGAAIIAVPQTASAEGPNGQANRNGIYSYLVTDIRMPSTFQREGAGAAGIIGIRTLAVVRAARRLGRVNLAGALRAG